jgi:hypothetical protein
MPGCAIPPLAGAFARNDLGMSSENPVQHASRCVHLS